MGKGVPQRSILWPFFSFVHKWSDWKLRLKSKAFFRWHILSFLSSYKGKIIFIPDHAKTAHEVIFSRKMSGSHHPLLMINVPVKRVPFNKHLGLILDSIVCFNSHINSVLSKIIALLQKFQYILPRHSLLTIYNIRLL